MTNHWRDIRHADLILVNGANPAEAHPVGFQWFVAARLDPKRGPGAGGGAKMVHADPRFTRTSALSDIYARIRTGTDVAYFGGLINYVLSHNLIHHEYVRNYTNASFLVKEGYGFHEGLFSGYDPAKRSTTRRRGRTRAIRRRPPRSSGRRRRSPRTGRGRRPTPARRCRSPSATCGSRTRGASSS